MASPRQDLVHQDPARQSLANKQGRTMQDYQDSGLPGIVWFVLPDGNYYTLLDDHYSPISSFHSAGLSRIKSAINLKQVSSSSTCISTPRDRK
jgi:hypothetical protein